MLLLASLTSSETSHSLPWADITEIANATNASFHAMVMPLAEMVTLTYTATYGSYYNHSQSNATVRGWARPLTRNPAVGMRALLFVHEASERAVVAFRGTDLNTSMASGEADVCGGHLLFSGSESSLPTFCSKFSPETIDYWTSAVAFVRRAREACPRCRVLFTGHSLGAGLAFLMAASLSGGRATHTVSPAVAFSSPPWTEALIRKAPHIALPSSAAMRSEWFALADEWDPVQREGYQRGGLLGTQCLWASSEPQPCKLCYISKVINLTRPSCRMCFAERHIYSHYIYHDVPGDRPRCSPILSPEEAPSAVHAPSSAIVETMLARLERVDYKLQR